MSSGRRRWWRSAGLRFGLAYAILFGFSTMAVVAFVWWSTAGELDRQTRADIELDGQALYQDYLQGGLPRLRTSLHKRIYPNAPPAGDYRDDGIYLLVNPFMQWVEGNLRAWPDGVDEDGYEEVRLRVLLFGEQPVLAEVQPITLLPSGYHLLIGRDVRIQELLWSKLSRATPWMIAMMGLLGIFGAITVRRLFASTLGDVSHTAASITAGDLASRVPLSGRGDEFDELAGTINQMLDRIGRLMDGVREVSNAIAHDLRTPIARARARLEDAAREGATETELRAAVDRAIADLDGVTRVFHALLRIAEIEAGARRSAFAWFDLSPLVRDLAELYEAAAEDGGQALSVEAPRSLPVFGDRDMVQQALANLLDNALKFSPGGTTVRIQATHRPDHSISIGVIDQGPGIPAADRDRATERFFRGESARNAPGSGLGLTLVQAVAVLHGGTLALDDNSPGLRAMISLPTSSVLMDRVSRETRAAAMPQAS